MGRGREGSLPAGGGGRLVCCGEREGGISTSWGWRKVSVVWGEGGRDLYQLGVEEG